MLRIVLKILITALLIVSVSEVSKRVSWMGAILASLPLTSILAIIWLYLDTRDVKQISTLSTGIFWAVLPSLVFFLVLPVFLKVGMRFSWAMLLSSIATFFGYLVFAWGLKNYGI